MKDVTYNAAGQILALAVGIGGFLDIGDKAVVIALDQASRALGEVRGQPGARDLPSALRRDVLARRRNLSRARLRSPPPRRNLSRRGSGRSSLSGGMLRSSASCMADPSFPSGRYRRVAWVNLYFACGVEKFSM